MDEKKTLDVTCGSKTIWFNKHHPNADLMAPLIRMEENG